MLFTGDNEGIFCDNTATRRSPRYLTMRIIKKFLLALLVLLVILAAYEAFRIYIAERATPQLKEMYLSENNLTVRLNQTPQKRIDILVKVEDPNFYQHKGIDFTTPGAGLTSITQAISKFMYFKNFHSGFNKIEQTLIARFVINENFTKSEQLSILYNFAYLGNVGKTRIIGFDAAAKQYFHTGFAKLTDQQYLSLVLQMSGQ